MDPTTTYSRKELEKETIPTLQVLCEKLGLKKERIKANIVDSLLESYKSTKTVRFFFLLFLFLHNVTKKPSKQSKKKQKKKKSLQNKGSSMRAKVSFFFYLK
jgi:hypothetical protein